MTLMHYPTCHTRQLLICRINIAGFYEFCEVEVVEILSFSVAFFHFRQKVSVTVIASVAFLLQVDATFDFASRFENSV